MNDEDKVKNLKKGMIGKVNLPYGNILLPLKMAQQLQEILAHAVTINHVWVPGEGKSFEYLDSLGDVSLGLFAPNAKNFYDCTGLPSEKLNKWRESCRKNLEETEDATPDTLTEPKVFCSYMK